jgi:hypothetical protein
VDPFNSHALVQKTHVLREAGGSGETKDVQSVTARLVWHNRTGDDH